MKGWFYTGRIFGDNEYSYLYFPIGCNQGFVGIEEEDGEYKKFDVALLPGGRVAEIEERDYEIVLEEEPNDQAVHDPNTGKA